MSYSIDLGPTTLILPPDNEGDTIYYSVIQDGNNQTCLDVRTHRSYGLELKVKRCFFFKSHINC